MSSLKPQDVLVALKLACIDDEDAWKFARLAESLFISLGAAHNAVTHLRAAGVVFEKSGAAVLAKKKFFDFLCYGVPVVFFPVKTGMGRGMPTMFYAPMLLSLSPKHEGPGPEISTVWAGSTGKVSGEMIAPLYETAPRAAALDAKLHELLALVDAVRAGRGKVRKLGTELLEQRLLGNSVESSEPAKSAHAEPALRGAGRAAT